MRPILALAALACAAPADAQQHDPFVVVVNMPWLGTVPPPEDPSPADILIIAVLGTATTTVTGSSSSSFSTTGSR